MDPSELEERLEEMTDLPAIPEVLARLLEALTEPHVCVEGLAKILVTDQALCLIVIRTANSVALGGREPAASLRDALTRLGLDALNKLVLAQQSSVLFSRTSEGFGLKPLDAWQGALAGAIAADCLARHAGTCPPSSAFTAGLLRDCGKMVMDALVGSESLSKVLEGDEDKSVPEREREAFGFDHAEIGATLARIWQLPEPLTVAIRHHHSPPPGEEDPLTDIVHCGDMISAQLGYGVGIDGLSYTFHRESHARVGLDLETMYEVLAKVRSELEVYKAHLGALSENEAA